MNDAWVAFGLTVFAGMATGIGSIIAFTAKRANCRFLSVATGFSAGVMLYVSFVEIFLLFPSISANMSACKDPIFQKKNMVFSRHAPRIDPTSLE